MVRAHVSPIHIAHFQPMGGLMTYYKLKGPLNSVIDLSDLSISEAIEWIKENANTCIASPTERRTSTTTTTQEEN